jgi:nitroreductase
MASMTELSGADVAASDAADAPAGDELDAFARLAWSRRTTLQMDLDRAVAPELVQELCEIAASAPNHKRTWPWRFCLFTGEGRAALGAAYAAALELVGADEAKIIKTRAKYLRAPAMLLVGSTSPEPGRVLEDGYAVAAALQNLLLAATAAGLASFWSSPPVPDAPEVLRLAGFPDGTQIVGVVYLGWPARGVESPARPPVELGRVTGFPSRP